MSLKLQSRIVRHSVYVYIYNKVSHVNLIALFNKAQSGQTSVKIPAVSTFFDIPLEYFPSYSVKIFHEYNIHPVVGRQIR